MDKMSVKLKLSHLGKEIFRKMGIREQVHMVFCARL